VTDPLAVVPASDKDATPDGMMEATPRRPASSFTQNAMMNVGRLLISTMVGFVLPSFLIRRLPVTTYSAWVLILQMSAYVAYLDLGIQSGISKYVAEYEEKGDPSASSLRASAGLALLLIVSVLGVLLTLILAWRVPALFHELPASLCTDVRWGMLFVGTSTAFALLCSIFASIFIGLRRFAVPSVLSLINRLLFACVVLGAVYFHQSLAMMGALVAVVNVSTGVLHFVAWRKLAGHVRLTLHNLDFGILRSMVAYCSSLAVWSVAMLLISGLDVTIVGRYDFRQTGFYAVATAPTNFMLAMMGAALAPLMPTASAFSVHRSSVEMGEMLAKATRYTFLLLVTSALPFLVCGYWILRVWVGHAAAIQIVGYLRILVLAHVLRNVCAPYANMLVATNRQRVAVAGAIAESVVNIVSSIYLVRRMGAIGVAYGTLLGSCVSVAVHFTVSMHYSYPTFSITRARLLWSGVLRPLTMAIPSALIVPLWWSASAPSMSPLVWTLWSLSTLAIGWFVGLSSDERGRLTRMAVARISVPVS
jgi:O-antigen/teichoic acid export membrane protein